MLVGLKSADNLGSILRICACFGLGRVHHVGLSGWTACPSLANDGLGSGLGSGSESGLGTGLPLGSSPTAPTAAPETGKGCGTISLSAQEYACMQVNGHTDLDPVILTPTLRSC